MAANLLRSYDKQRRPMSFGWTTFSPILFFLFLRHLAATPSSASVNSWGSSSSEESSRTGHPYSSGEDDEELIFTRPFYNATIPENSVGKTFVVSSQRMGIYIAPSYGELNVRFKIVAGDRDSLFKADARQVGDFCFLLIRTRTGQQGVLNREFRDWYLLRIKATLTAADSNMGLVSLGSGNRSFKAKARTEVFVRVTDTNDLNPLFPPVGYNTSLPEDTPLNQPFLIVSASDADLGVNGEIYYSFLQPTLHFAVHPTRGSITLTRPLNFRDQSLHLLTVVAEDRGPKATVVSKGSSTTVTVHVVESNRYAPEISVRSYQTAFSPSGGGNICAIVRVTDKDRGQHGEIAGLAIISGEGDGLFKITDGQSLNEYNIELDRKPEDGSSMSQEYSLTLRAVDNGTPQKESTQVVRIKISDAFEKAPVFEKESYQAEVSEVVPINTPIICLTVVQHHQQNENSYDDILYHLEDGNAGGSFHLNPKTGQLSTAKPLDHETRPHYTLTVSAAHRGIRGYRKKKSVKIDITVLDANDNDPVFNLSHSSGVGVGVVGYNVVVIQFFENQEAGTVVYTARAEDRDAGENGYISYSLANLNVVPFSVDHFTGEVKTIEKLDYETSRRDYVLKVRASDWGAPYRRQAELTLRVKIRDFNDNRPQFEKIGCVVRVLKKAPINTELVTLSAIDFDHGAMVTYRLVPSNDDTCFRLDGSTGVLRLICDLSKQAFREKTLNVSATDGSYFSDVMSVDIKVVSGTRLASGPSSSNGDKLSVSECRDVGVTERFKEQMRLGELNNRGGVDDDVTEPTPTRFTENRHAPEFPSALPIEIQIKEDEPVGSQVALAGAKDPDHGYNGRVVHVISNGDDDGRFHLDLETGLLAIERPLDRERVPRYLLNISAYDLGAPQKSVSRILAIRVLDVNDNPPVFEKNAYSFVVPENAKNGTSVVRLRATDADEGANAEMLFNLLTDALEFAVDSRTGLISVVGNLDREKSEIHALRVRVTDSDPEHPLSSTTLVTIRLKDENDNAPYFVQSNLVLKVREDLPVGSVLIFLIAHDPDLGDGGVVRYDIIKNTLPGTLGDDTECLSVDPLSGVIRLTSKLDFETRQLYNLTVRARDRGVPSLSSVTNLLVEVEDVDENIHPPRFPDFVTTSSVKENQPVGTLVTTVTATDADTLQGIDNRIVYSIRGGNGLGLFSIDNQGNIRTRVVLDSDTESRYWLTVFAQDRGSAPLSSTVEVFIRVLNENDNAPLTLDPVYYIKVSEESPVNSFVLRVDAFDLDNNNLPSDVNMPRPTFKLSPPKGFFQIDSETGVITTTTESLDRETESLHILEVIVSDNGEPAMESITRIVVDVEDINDNHPEFMKVSYRFNVPEMSKSNSESILCRVIAWDPDEGKNGEVTYSILDGLSSGMFSINPISGEISTREELKSGSSYEITIKASDGGSPSLSSNAVVVLEIMSVPKESARPPVLRQSGSLRADTSTVQVTEKDKVGHLVFIIDAQDPDNDPLWYSIQSGNEDHSFTIEPRGNALTLARPLDWETKSSYNLSIKITDMVHSVFFLLHVDVWDENEHSPLFVKRSYSVDIPETLPLGTPFFQLNATDGDHEKRLFYAIHNSASPSSLDHFQIDERTGSVSVSGQVLDFESCRKHILTIEVKDQGTPAKRDYARLLINVQDRNDHAPEFLSPMFTAKVFETSALGTAVVQLLAVDRDKGKNAEITYTIVSGNIGGAFSIDFNLGILQVAHDLDSQVMPEYFLSVRANDQGAPTLNSTVTVHIKVTQADNASPMFEQGHYSAELFENERPGTSVASFTVRSRSSVYFEILDGNEDSDFKIDSISGLVSTDIELDFEKTKFYNLTVRATNMVGSNTSTTLSVHVLDRNDNRPEFDKDIYLGWVSESAEVGSFALKEDNNPLVVKATDKDSERNSILNFEIVEKFAQKYFQIDKTTGAVSILSPLDHETHPYFIFSVHLSDLGRPRLNALGPAQVNITVLDVNDCAPVFYKSLYTAILLLPTYKGVVVTKVEARDPDSSELKYSIVSGNTNEQFIIDSLTGEIIVRNPENAKNEYEITIAVDDGQFESSCVVKILIRETRSSGLKFSLVKYEVELAENVADDAKTICVVTVLGSALNEHVTFSIRNPSPMFAIGKTSGAVRTTGKPFDREVKSSYTLVVEAKSELLEAPRVAHVLVEVTITDMNDNAPMFVNLPYHCVVPVEAQPGDLVRKVQAIDLDIGPNGFVHYELTETESEAFFTIDSKTGDIRLKQNLGTHNTDYHLIVVAIDSGSPSLKSEITVPVKVINRNMPVFPRQFYSVAVPENIGSQIPVLTVQATSPQGRQLIYSIVEGNQLEEFAVDFNTDPGPSSGPCVIYVVEQLDYESTQIHQLTLRATDSVSGAYAEVQVSISVEDVNDNPPVFAQASFNASVSELSPLGTSVLKLIATDRDTGSNKKIQFQLVGQKRTEDEISVESLINAMDGGDLLQSAGFFHLDPSEGILFIKQLLDHERYSSHHLTVVAHDGGSPSLSSTAHIWIKVLDTNDNPPKFEHATYSCSISEHAQRDQFVTMVVASDPDESDQNKLAYSIVGGNDLQAFHIDKLTGIVYLANVHHLSQQSRHMLNVSVTDGVHSAHTRIWVDVKSANRHTPIFSKTSYEVALSENAPSGSSMVILTAIDDDGGEYGRFTFGIQSQEGRQLFTLNPNTGEIKSQEVLDREVRHIYEVPVTATDRGGRVGFSVMRVTVTDSNDNVPQFSVAEYRTSINANTTVGTTVLKVHASDADEGAAGSIEYSIYENANDDGQQYSILGRGGIRISTTSIFAVTHDSGEIYLQQKLLNLQNEEFQFFVRARDKGSPRQESHVPVVMRIADGSETVPSFEQLSYEFFLSEGSPLGTVVTTLNVSSFPVRFKLAPALEGTDADLQLSKFSVDPVTGRLSLMAQLDREQEATYAVTVQAESVMSGGRGNNNGLITSTDILIRVMDENDNPPIFESEYYSVEIAENSPKGSTVLRVAATDKDLGRSADIVYSFGDGGEIAAAVFQLDPKLGWITTISILDREAIPKYRFEVLATDGGSPSLKASVWVEIEIKDYNDNPTVFKKQSYTVSVNEEHLPGFVLIAFDTKDADLEHESSGIKDFGKQNCQFYITSGNPQTTFGISLAGEVYINKPLDREMQSQYSLKILVTDGIFVTNTELLIDVNDVNDNAPVCLKSKYTELVSESIAPQTYILTVDATDADEGKNALLEFSISGIGSEDMYIDSTSGLGLLKTSKPLDRERQSRYSLVAHVRDMGKPEWYCNSALEIILSDVNDNAPVFSQDMYSVSVPEDSQVGTLVAKVHATDPDLGMNRRVSYSFVDSAHGHFSVDYATGIVRLRKPLDRETRSMYNLTVQAKDHGTPQLSSLTTLIVLVQDINDNPPEFAQTLYYTSVSESAVPGSEVLRVFATSKDSGVNAEITYTVIEGNEFGSLEIHPKSGVISVSKLLDYEAIRDYCLTILARDGGTPPLSNQVIVNISVTDANDNPPVFSQPVFFALVSEDARIGFTAIQLLASDADSATNGKLTFNLRHGDTSGQFLVHPETGDVVVANSLDRELVSNYVLQVECIDGGIPPLAATALINIEVSDINDNPPLFSQANFSTIVQEGKPIGFTILKFLITDNDAPPNDGPFKLDIISGNEDKSFRLVQQDATLRSARVYNHLERNNYSLHIRVTDRGSPPLSSETWVHVRVIEESKYPPVVRPLRISVSSYLDDFHGGALGRISAIDDDPYDKLTFDIVSQHNHLFMIGREDGLLSARAGLDVGNYDVNISVTDGKFTSHSMILVEVVLVSQEAVENSVILRLAGVTPEDFILSYQAGFIKGLQDVFGVRPRGIELLSVQPAKKDRDALKTTVSDKPLKIDKSHKLEKSRKKNQRRSKRRDFLSFLDDEDANEESFEIERERRSYEDADLDVLFAVQKTSGLGPNRGTYFQPNEMRSKLRDKWSSFQANLRLKVVQVSKNRCTDSYCANGQCQDKIILDQSTPLSITTDTFSLVFPQHVQKTLCICHLGFGGNHCELVINECAKQPCPPTQICVPSSDLSSPLLAHTIGMSPSGVLETPGYTCQCPAGKGGLLCDQELEPPCENENCYIPRSPMSFLGQSYTRCSVNTPIDRHLTLSIHFRTKQASGNLMFASGYRDFSILEIYDGYIRFRFDCGSGEGVVRVESPRVNDAFWHLVELERHGNMAKVTIDKQYKAAGGAKGVHDILNMDGSDIYFGAEVRWFKSNKATTAGGLAITGNNNFQQSSFQVEDIRMGFIGCLDDIKIDTTSIPLHEHSSNLVATLKKLKNVEFHCRSLIDPGPCGIQPCHNGASCTLTSSNVVGSFQQGFICQCPPRFVGPFCKTDTDPCASDPCLNGGICRNLDNDYECVCPSRISGKRCDYGRFCNPNPCLNKAACEEGTSGPICKCRGFHGDRCQHDVDECQLSPCARGATCINLIGSFQCHCPANVTGILCNDHLYTTSITSSAWNTTLEEVIGIALVITFILALAFLLACCWRYRHKRRRHRPNNEIRDDQVAGEFLMKNTVLEKDNLKRQSKVSNLEMTTAFGTGCQQPPIVPPRPLSYTPSNQQPLHPNAHPHRLNHQDSLCGLNKFETLNSYGSAGADLESLPRYSSEFLQNISKPMSVSSSGGGSATGYNTNPVSGGCTNKIDCWEDVPKDKIYEEKIQNDLKDARLSPQNRNNYSQQTNAHGISSSTTSPGRNGFSGVNSALSMASMDDSPGYHWDISDWATQKPLSNITEVSMNELRDSSSLHSGESNSQVEPLLGLMAENNPTKRPSLLPGLTQNRLRQHQRNAALDAEQSGSEYVGDSDANQNELDDAASSSLCIEGLSPCLDNSPTLNPTFDELLGKDLEFADDGVESLPPSPNKYAMFHPNQYLPSHRDPKGSNSAALSWTSDLKPNICELSEEEDACYSPFHNNNNPLRGSLVDRSTSSDPNGDQTKTSGIDSMSISLGGYTSTNASCSDISAHVCEIEDSEANMSDCDEVYHHGKQQQVPLLRNTNNNTIA